MHPSHYGRMCPIETPEGPNIGLIGYLVELRAHQPVRLHRDAVPQGRATGRVTDEIEYLAADDEDRYVIAQANAADRRQGPLPRRPRRSCAPAAARSRTSTRDEVDYMDVSPKQIVSVATALIPFLEHDDANRALMGANMQRQAVPLLRADRAVHRHRCRGRAARDAGDVILAEGDGTVVDVTGDTITRRVRGPARPHHAPARQVPPLEPGHLHQPEAARSTTATR